MFHTIKQIPAKIIVGYKKEVTIATDAMITSQLFREFLPQKATVLSKSDNTTLCVKLFPQPLEMDNPHYCYQKWAAVEVTKVDENNNLEVYTIPAGLYAIFLHRGRADNLSTFQYIFQQWLPTSGYQLDCREQFEILPENYNPFDDNAEEWIYIPIKPV